MAAVLLLLLLLNLELLIEQERLRRMARELGVGPKAMESGLEYALGGKVQDLSFGKVNIGLTTCSRQ